MRERLIELIESARYWGANTSEEIADRLLSEGVIVPPVKVGQKIWVVSKEGQFTETTVEKIVLKNGGLYLKLWCNSFYETTCRSIGKTVFLTKEEAEKALAERSK
jgi:hypothetical protein